MIGMRRRSFITLLGGAGAAWPRTARAQEPVRRIGVILPATSDDAEFQSWVEAFLQGLAQLGWTIGHNVRIDTRWATANGTEIRRHAAELVSLAPDGGGIAVSLATWRSPKSSSGSIISIAANAISQPAMAPAARSTSAVPLSKLHKCIAMGRHCQNNKPNTVVVART
jgi:hypothetical protein